MKRLPTTRRRSVGRTFDDLVEVTAPDPDSPFLRILTPRSEAAEIDLPSWAGGQTERIEELLTAHGALLFRGFPMQAERIEEVVRALYGEPLEYRDRATPRSRVEGRIYSSTDYPADQHIELHNENCYAKEFPSRILFFCRQPAQSGGETPVADCRRVYELLDPEVRRPFEERGVMYVRNFREGLGLSWQEVFGTDDRDEMEAFCRAADIEVEWVSPDHLRTRQVRPAVALHPRTGDALWMNQAVAFHVTTLDPEVRQRLLDELGEEGIPKNARYGDGSAIEAETLERVREAYRAATVALPWQRGDLMLLDNLRTAHGRRPYSGPRSVVVGMAAPVAGEDVWARPVGEER